MKKTNYKIKLIFGLLVGLLIISSFNLSGEAHFGSENLSKEIPLDSDFKYEIDYLGERERYTWAYQNDTIDWTFNTSNGVKLTVELMERADWQLYQDGQPYFSYVESDGTKDIDNGSFFVPNYGIWHCLFIHRDASNPVLTVASYDVVFNHTDYFEENDVFADAAEVFDGASYDSLHCGDPDWFKIELDAYEEVTIRVDDLRDLPILVPQDVVLTLYDASETYLASEYGNQRTSVLDLTYQSSVRNTWIYFSITQGGTDWTHYDLNISVVDNSHLDDIYEENDVFADAVSVTDGDSFNDLLCNDLDWFKINLDEYEEVTIYADDFYDLGLFDDIDLILYDDTEIYVDSDSGSTWAEVVYEASADNTWMYFVIDPTDGVYSTYDLNISVVDNTPPDDIYEDNDVFADAVEVFDTDSFDDLYCGDLDWFKINLDEYEEVTIYADDFYDLGLFDDLDLILYDDTETYVDSNAGSTWAEVVYEATADNTWMYFVIDPTDGVFSTYDLNITVVQNSPPEDVYEENDVFADAVEVFDGTSLDDLYCGDLDWFKIILDEYEEVTIYVDDFYDLGLFDELDLILYDDTETYVDSNAGSTWAEVVYQATEDNTWMYFVIDPTDGVFSRYDLNISIVDNTPPDDFLEDNDVFADAVEVFNGTFYNDLYSRDVDWFKVEVNSYEWLTIDVDDFADLSILSADMNLTIYDDMEFQIWSTSDTSLLQIIFQPALDNTIVYFTIANEGDETSYDLNITLILDVTIDKFEENDIYAEAAEVFNGDYHWDLHCDDEDWFKIELSERERVTIQIEIWDLIFTENELDLILYDSTGLVELDQNSGNYSVEVAYTSPADSTWVYFLIYPIDGVPSDYTLNITTQIIDDDWFEENDVYSEAVEVFDGDYHANLTCKDDDWYKIELSAGESVTIYVEIWDLLFTGYQLDLILYDSTGSVILDQNSGSSWALVTYTSTADNTWVYFVVYPMDGVPSDYDLEISIIADDEFEENDVFEDAHSISAGTYSDLKSLEDDDDWYKIELQAGSTIEITIFFSDLEGDLDLHFLDGADSYISSSESVDDNEFLSISITADGKYYILVDQFSLIFDTPVTYDLRIVVTPPKKIPGFSPILITLISVFSMLGVLAVMKNKISRK